MSALLALSPSCVHTWRRRLPQAIAPANPGRNIRIVAGSGTALTVTLPSYSTPKVSPQICHAWTAMVWEPAPNPLRSTVPPVPGVQLTCACAHQTPMFIGDTRLILVTPSTRTDAVSSAHTRNAPDTAGAGR